MTFEEFTEQELKTPIEFDIVHEWGRTVYEPGDDDWTDEMLWENGDAKTPIREGTNRETQVDKEQCIFVGIYFDSDYPGDEVTYLCDGQVCIFEIENEYDWDWDEFFREHSNIKYLQIHECTDVPEIIFDLKELIYLELFRCSIDMLAFHRLSDLSGLETLSLNESNIFRLPESVYELQSLKVLSVMDTQITELPEELLKLGNLRYLGLNGLDIAEGPHVVGKMTWLTHLYLGRTGIRVLPEEMKGLVKLEHLALWETSLERLPDWICDFTDLRGLYLGRDKNITLLPERIGDLVNLEKLYLDGTGITELPESFGNLSNLTELTLQNTAVRKFPTLSPMNRLKQCNLSGLTLERIPKEFISDKMEIDSQGDFWGGGLNLEGTKLLCQPISLFSHEKEFINAYYEEEKIHLNETKVVFLGDGEAGKSHIIARIKAANAVLTDFAEESTPGIAISPKECIIDGEDIRLQIWDFGGQEIMHSMHRFFLTERTLYVVVINARDNTQDERAEYWLNNVKSFANGCPVIIVLNKMDQNPTASINERLLRNDYPQIVRIMKMPALKDNCECFGGLMEEIISTVRTFDSYAMDFPVSWNQIKTTLTEMDSNYITDPQYREICRTNSVEDKQIQDWLLDWFHDLGVSFNYHKKDQLLRGYMVLKPTWITNAIYIILFNGSNYAKNGIISKESIVSLLEEPPKSVENIKYNVVEVPYILGVMERFEISYALDDRHEFIPMMCDKNQHEEAGIFMAGDCLEYYMEYDYLPNNVLHKLMIRMQKDFDKDKIWLTGMILQARENHISALVRMHEKRMEIFVKSTDSSLYPEKEYMSEIRDNLLAINRELNLHAKDTIVYREGGMVDRIEYSMLLIHLASRESSYFSPVFRKRIPIRQILGVVENEIDTDSIVRYCSENENVDVSVIYRMLSEIHAKNDYVRFEEELLECCVKLQGDTLQILEGKENDRNTYLRNLLSVNKNYIVCDQTLNGISGGGKAAGELDLLIKNRKSMPIAIVEALNLDSLNQDNLSRHIDKIYTYDTWGLPRNYILVYAEGKNFTAFKDKYREFIEQYEYPYESEACVERGALGERAVFDVTLQRNDKETVLTHILVHMQ